MVLPIRGRPGRPADRPIGKTGETGITSPGVDALPPRANERLGLVEPQRHVGLDPEDEPARDPRLGLGERPWAGVLRVPALTA
jgi:hypothetical protein